jgi:hypothetical protein
MIKKKGRKPKSYYENLKNDLSLNNQEQTIEEVKPVKEHKKRGRKPKGGIVVEQTKTINTIIPIPNIILHLNCKLSDILNSNNDYSNTYNPYVENVNDFNNDENCNYDFLANNDNNNNIDNNIDNNNIDNNNNINDINSINNFNCGNNIKKNFFIDVTINNNSNNDSNNNSNNNSNNIKIEYELNKKNIAKKLKELSFNLKYNNMNNKSDCFWCTYCFDNEPIVIPKHELNNQMYCYGNFCSPECACAYLMKEKIDSSTQFERYYLLNNIYGKIYNYDKNIKPAPDPHYLLKKFNGNMEIQEYRKLLENERLLLIVDKPLSRTFPEIFEDNDDFLLNCKTLSKNNC